MATALPGSAAEIWEPLPGGRVNRLWRVGAHVVKLYDPAGASPLFPNDAEAEAHALRLLCAEGIAPRFAAEGDGWLAYIHVPGQLWSGDPRPVAAALARLHDLPFRPLPGFRHVPSGITAVLEQGAAIIRDARLTLPPPPDLPPQPLVPGRLIHGDVVPGNILVEAGGITLIDWQCPAIGDPVEDIATFLSPAMQWLYRGEILPKDCAEAFLTACPPDRAARYRAMAPAFHWRMAAHCAWKAAKGDADYAAALPLEIAALNAVSKIHKI